MATPEEVAPDGSTVRPLTRTGRASLAEFVLAPGAVTRPVRHESVEELWYVLAGEGALWLGAPGAEREVTLRPGVAADIPVGIAFQFRAGPGAPLRILAVTVPPWPVERAEARPAAGPWEPSLPPP